jgi:hypothetical protein
VLQTLSLVIVVVCPFLHRLTVLFWRKYSHDNLAPKTTVSRCKKGQTTTITNESVCNTKSTPINQNLSFVDTFSFDIEAPFDTIKMSGRYPIKLTSDYFSEEKSLTGDTAKLYLNDPETNTVAKSLFSTSTESVFSSPLSNTK